MNKGIDSVVEARIGRATYSLKRRSLLAALPCAVIAGAGLTAATSRTETKNPISLGGLSPFREVYLTPRREKTNLDAVIAYPFGERHNHYGEGLAHYVEHLVWGSIRGSGLGSGQHGNAWTSPQATLYWAQRGPNELRNTIERLAASAAPLVVDEAYAVRARDIVQREFDLTHLEDPMDAANSEMASKLFGDSTYARKTLGSKSTISRFTLEAARILHDETHHLSSATLHLRGPVTEQEVVRAIESIEGWPTPRAEMLNETLPLWSEAPEIVVNRAVPGLARPRIVKRKTVVPPLGFSWPEVFAAGNVLENWARSPKPGGLARPLFFNAFLAVSFDISLEPLGKAGLVLGINAEPDKRVSLSDLNDTLDQELARLFRVQDETSFDEMRYRELSSVDSVHDSLKANHERLIASLLAGTAYVPLAELSEALRDLTFARFQLFAQQFLKPRSAVTQLISTS